MQFKHPEILYALLLLLIPIIVHLFQLRRFQKVEFTNVKFLKNVELQTRKSSQIKKWLTLLTRLLIVACAVIAFAQPYISNSNSFNTKNEIVVYLDNSHSMQAKGVNGSLLNEAIQDIIGSIDENEEITLYTNKDVYRNTTLKAIKNELIQMQYSSNQLSYEAAYLKGKQYFSKAGNSIKNLILLSDFQQKDDQLNFQKDSLINLKLVQPKAVNKSNISIDSIYIETKANNKELNVLLSAYDNVPENVSISLYNNDNLLAKTAVDLNAERPSAMFTLPNNDLFNGKLVIDDPGLEYDNVFYFNLNKQPKIKVLTINNTSDIFLRKLYTDDEFEYSSYDLEALNYNLINSQNFIILNELNSIPNTLQTALNTFSNNGGSILIIPSNDISFNSYNQLFTNFKISKYDSIISAEKRITTINYDHPLLAEAFYKRVSNFQYPKVNAYYRFEANTNNILSYEDNSAFLTGNRDIYAFSSALNDTNSNFKGSPLIVPVLYNIAKQSIKLSQLYYHIDRLNTISIETVLGSDEILTLVNDENSIIPQQQTYSNKVDITTEEYPTQAGILEVRNSNESLQNLSFNFNRNESQLSYYDLESNTDYSTNTNLASAIDDIKSNTNVNELWKWFVIFALAFLIIEMLILKYLK